MPTDTMPKLGDLIEIENDAFDMSGVVIEVNPTTEFITIMDSDGPMSFHLWNWTWTINGNAGLIGN